MAKKILEVLLLCFVLAVFGFGVWVMETRTPPSEHHARETSHLTLPSPVEQHVCRPTVPFESGALCIDALDNDCDGVVDLRDPSCRTPSDFQPSETHRLAFTMQEGMNCQFVALVGNAGEPLNASCYQNGKHIECASTSDLTHSLPRMICR